MEEKKSNPVKAILYISVWVIIWGTLGSFIDFLFILIIFKLIYYQIKLNIIKKIKAKIIIHKNCNLKIN